MNKTQSFEELLRERILNRQPGKGFEIRNQDGTAEIRIYDVIGWPYIEAQDIAAQLDGIAADEIVVSINSPGGSVFESIAIYNALRQHPARIVTRVDALAASGASIIAQAGDRRQMVSASQMMIHNAWAIAVGDGAAMHKTGDLLEKQDSNLAAIYGARSGRAPSEFAGLMADETWFLADEAVEAGLADEVVDPRPDSDTQAKGSRLADHLSAVAVQVDEVTERVAEVASLRSEQGKSLDGSWRTRNEVDQFAASLNRLVETLSSDDDEPESHGEPDGIPSDLEAEYLRFVASELDEKEYHAQLS